MLIKLEHGGDSGGEDGGDNDNWSLDFKGATIRKWKCMQ